MRYLVISILLKGWSTIKNFLSIYELPALLTLISLLPFTTKEINDCTNGATKAPRNPPSCFLIHTPSINTPKSANHFMVLIISFISSFRINKVDPFPALKTTFLLLFCQIYLLHLS